MGNYHNLKVTTFQGFAIPSMPLIVALMRFVDFLQLLSHLNHINISLETLFATPQNASPPLSIVCSTLHPLIGIASTCSSTL